MEMSGPARALATLIEPSGDIAPRVLAALPKPDVKVDAGFPRLTYMHRGWRDQVEVRTTAGGRGAAAGGRGATAPAVSDLLGPVRLVER